VRELARAADGHDGSQTSLLRNQFEPDGVSLIVYVVPGRPMGAAMNQRDTEECLKRAEECARQADAAVDPELKIYLMKLALSWTQAAGETVERELRASTGRPTVTKSASRPLPQ
jgi:hypothetical protein